MTKARFRREHSSFYAARGIAGGVSFTDRSRPERRFYATRVYFSIDVTGA
jgi:hypothetical protein